MKILRFLAQCRLCSRFSLKLSAVKTYKINRSGVSILCRMQELKYELLVIDQFVYNKLIKSKEK